MRKADEILGMGLSELRSLDPGDFSNVELGAPEIIHIARKFSFFWEYNYEAAQSGKSGKHALLKSGLHSDKFLALKMLLEIQNIRLLMAHQLELKFRHSPIALPDALVGIPDAATKLAADLANILRIDTIDVRKINNHIQVIEQIPNDESLLVVEDIHTTGAGFKETLKALTASNPNTVILSYEMVIINRGAARNISLSPQDVFKVVPVAEYRINEWTPEECPLCKMGSVPIKPKVSPENWEDITTSQL